MSTLRKQMIQQMQLENYSPKTIQNYISAISLLASFYHTPADQLTIVQIRDYILIHINEKKRSIAWMNIRISAVKFLFCEVLKREWNKIDLPRPRRVYKKPVVLSKKEVRQIIISTSNIKHKAILMLAYSGGLRISEICHLKIKDIDSGRMLIHVKMAKGNKDRYTILSPVALALLRDYYRKYRPKEWLFESNHIGPLSRRTMEEVFKQAVIKSNISKHVSFHSLRHSFATHLVEQGVALPIIQQMMGHQSLRTTSGYLHVQEYSVQGVKSPLDALSI